MRHNPTARVEELETEQILAKLLNSIDEDRRMTIILRELEGLSYEEISDAMNVPVGTVRSRIARGRDELSKLTGKLKDKL